MNDAIIDRPTFLALQDAAGADFVAELIVTFLEEAPLLMAELNAAAARGDAPALRRAAHSIKSNAQTFGAQALGQVARTLELGPVPPDPHDLSALAPAFAAAAAALEALRHG